MSRATPEAIALVRRVRAQWDRMQRRRMGILVMDAVKPPGVDDHDIAGILGIPVAEVPRLRAAAHRELRRLERTGGVRGTASTR